MPRFSWSRKQPGALSARLPGRKFRVTVFLLVAGFCAAAYAVAGPSTLVLIAIVMCAPVIALVVPELFELWEWWIGRAEAHAVQRDERIYRFGYADIRMRMAGRNPWFAAADVCGALGLADIREEIRYFDVTRCDVMGEGGEWYLSEAAVIALAERSRHPDARSFRIWFEREVMFPFERARKARAGDNLSRREGS